MADQDEERSEMQILANRNFRFAKIWLFFTLLGLCPGFY